MGVEINGAVLGQRIHQDIAGKDVAIDMYRAARLAPDLQVDVPGVLHGVADEPEFVTGFTAVPGGA